VVDVTDHIVNTFHCSDYKVEREEEVNVGAKQQQGDDRNRECKDGIPL